MPNFASKSSTSVYVAPPDLTAANSASLVLSSQLEEVRHRNSSVWYDQEGSYSTRFFLIESMAFSITHLGRLDRLDGQVLGPVVD